MRKFNLKYIYVLLLLFLISISLSSQELKIMSYNSKSFETMVMGPESFQMQQFADEIAQYNPDIVCFQELETHTGRMDSREVLTELGSLLGMYPLFGYSYNKDIGWYGNGILTKYPIINSYSGRLSYDKKLSHDQRSYMWADVLVPVVGKPEGQIIRVVNTHLDHRNEPTDGQREEHAKYIVGKAFDAGIPALLTGDMNCGVSAPPTQAYLTICDRMCDDRRTFRSGSKLDYIYGYPKNKWTSVAYEVYYSSTLSDHYPIMATVKLK